jgi:hypothetical protein
MATAIFFLTCYHLLLFRHFYFQNPFIYARSEALEQGFASSILLGRSLYAGKLPVDTYYYPDYLALPFLSSFYPPHMASAWIATFLPLNQAWMLYAFTMVSHFWLASVSVYILASNMGAAPLTAGFASLTLSSLGYAMKQNSCIVYTLAWIPTFLFTASLQSSLLCGISLGMMLLAGYWPIALYVIPLGCLCWLLA